jgi:hypothetical protein
MDDANFDEHVRMIMSMCLECLRGGISRQTFVANLEMVSRILLKEAAKDGDSTDGAGGSQPERKESGDGN